MVSGKGKKILSESELKRLINTNENLIDSDDNRVFYSPDKSSLQVSVMLMMVIMEAVQGLVMRVACMRKQHCYSGKKGNFHW